MSHTSPGAARTPRALLHAQLVNAVGDGAFYVSSALCFTRIVGLSAPQIGAGLAVAWAVGSLAGVPLGHLADRRGPRGTAVLLALATAVSVASFLALRSFVPLLSLALPLWIVERTAAPGWTVSALFVLNTGVVTLFQVRAARSVTDLSTAARAVRWSGAVMCAACAVFALSGAVSGALSGGLPGSLPGSSPEFGRGAGAGAVGAAVAVLVLGTVLQVLAEMRHSAGAWQIGFALAPADRIGQYQGFYGTGVPVARTLGPLLVTTLLIGWGMPGWLLLGGVFLVAGAATGPAVRWAEAAR